MKSIIAVFVFAFLLKACDNTPSTAKKVDLKWKPSPDFTSMFTDEYRVYKGSPDCSKVQLYASGLSKTTFTDSNVTAGNRYCYKVSHYDKLNKNESLLSEQAVVAVP